MKSSKKPDLIYPSVVEAAYRLGSYEAYLVMDRMDLANKVMMKSVTLGDNWDEIRDMISKVKQ